MFNIRSFDTFFSGIALFIHFYSNLVWMHGFEKVRDLEIQIIPRRHKCRRQ